VSGSIEGSIGTSNHDWVMSEFCNEAAKSVAPQCSELRQERPWKKLIRQLADDDSESGQVFFQMQLISLNCAENHSWQAVRTGALTERLSG
jgi:hypothetical protein